MKERYKKLVFENGNARIFEAAVPKGKCFKISEGKEGELIIKTVPEITANYTRPPVPRGYEYVEGGWNDGFVIERCSDGSQFVWVPVGSLDCDGESCISPFSEKFGRRNFGNNNVFGKCTERYTKTLEAFYNSVDKYGGFYISRYVISQNDRGKPQSISGAEPWVNISCVEATDRALNFSDSVDDTVWYHRPYACEYDSVLAWFVKSGARTLEEIKKDSSGWGNYKNSKDSAGKIAKTGSNEEWCTNRIYDFAGNVREFTAEKYLSTGAVCRGGSYKHEGPVYAVGSRHACSPICKFDDIGFRVAMYIK